MVYLKTPFHEIRSRIFLSKKKEANMLLPLYYNLTQNIFNNT